MNKIKLSIEERLEIQGAKIQAIADGLNAILVDFAKIDDAEEVQKERPWNPDNIDFVEAKGTRGPYGKADPKTEGSKPDFKAMLKDLKDHNGKMRREGYFYWVFASDQATVGRKRIQ